MSLRCGLHAVNALLRAAGRSPVVAADLDAITARLHARERAVCPEGRDTAPDPEGNYPIETLIVALRRAGIRATYVRPTRGLATRTPARTRTPVVGFLVGTGGHYVAVVRDDAHSPWRVVDNGVTTATATAQQPSPRQLVMRTLGRRAAAALRCVVRPSRRRGNKTPS